MLKSSGRCASRCVRVRVRHASVDGQHRVLGVFGLSRNSSKVCWKTTKLALPLLNHSTAEQSLLSNLASKDCFGLCAWCKNLPTTAASPRISPWARRNPHSTTSLSACRRSGVKIDALPVTWWSERRKRTSVTHSSYREKLYLAHTSLPACCAKAADFPDPCVHRSARLNFCSASCLDNWLRRQGQQQTQPEKGWLWHINWEAPASRCSSAQYKQMNTKKSRKYALCTLLLLRKWLFAEKILTQERQIPLGCIKQSACIK